LNVEQFSKIFVDNTFQGMIFKMWKQELHTEFDIKDEEVSTS